MGRIGIITFHRAINCGAVLQAYALQETLASCGADCKIIDFRSAAIEQFYNPMRIVKGSFVNKMKQVAVGALRFRSRSRKRNAFRDFNARFLRMTEPVSTADELRKLPFDAVVTGSDQVFNPDIPGRDAWNYYLSFAGPGVKRYSYAASFGKGFLQDRYKPFAARELAAFTGISVREKSGADIVRELTGREAGVDVDPTLLAGADMWRGLEKKPRGVGEPYLLVYNMLQNELLHETAEKVRKERNLKVLFVNNKLEAPRRKYNRFEYRDSDSPQEFLWLMDHAACVISSSFHGNVFSALFHKPFITILPKNQPKNERNLDLLEMLGLQDRLFTENPDTGLLFRDPDWERVDERLRDRRESSMAYLREVAASAAGDAGSSC